MKTKAARFDTLQGQGTLLFSLVHSVTAPYRMAAVGLCRK